MLLLAPLLRAETLQEDEYDFIWTLLKMFPKMNIKIKDMREKGKQKRGKLFGVFSTVVLQ